MGTPSSSCFTEEYFYMGESDDRFCERYADAYAEHEYVNSFSALFIVFMGWNQLNWDHSYSSIRFLSACFIVNGIASFLTHWYATRDFYILDNTTMYIPAWLVTASMTYDLTVLHLKSRVSERWDVAKRCTRGFIWTSTGVVIFVLLWNDIVGCGLRYHNTIFIIGFAFPPLMLVIGCIFFISDAFKVVNERYKVEYAHKFEQSFIFFTWGIALSLIGAFVWFAVELVACPRVSLESKKKIAHIPAHAVWHISQAYGFTLITVFILSLKALTAQIRTDARYDSVKEDENRSPDFAFNYTEACCGCCQSRPNSCSVLLPFPAKEDGSVNGDPYSIAWITKKNGFCRCWIDIICGRCCGCKRCTTYHYPLPEPQNDEIELAVHVANNMHRLQSSSECTVQPIDL